MKVDIFDFELNKELIATEPASPRDSSKLLDLSINGQISDRRFHDLPSLLNPEDILVFNDTKVIPAKLYGRRGQAELEVTLYRLDAELNWWAFIKNSKRLKIGDTITFYSASIPIEKSTFTAKVLEKKEDDGVLLSLNSVENLEIYGSMPLPPYIKREKLENKNDTQNYQTVYAKNEGAVAAPTAGLHFTPEVMAALEQKGVKKVFLTLHVGAGTFLPVKTEDTIDHKMHSEFGIISGEAADKINQAKASGGRVIAVGTTSLRLLETAADDQGILHPFSGDTNIFITPGYKFKIIDAVITNFHLPKSTLFMLVCAIAGTDFMKSAYKHAMLHNYRFYSYGDSSIISCINKL